MRTTGPTGDEAIIEATPTARDESVSGEDVLGGPTFMPGRILEAAETSYQCNDVDVYCYMGSGAPAGKSMVRLPSIRGSVGPLLPKGTACWCRAGDAKWTRVTTAKEVDSEDCD